MLGGTVTPAIQFSSGLLALGLITGMTYGIMAVGLVLVYRSSRVVNFAHGEIGAFGAAVTGALVIQWRVPYWIAFAAGVTVSALVGAATEVAVVRRLRNAPKLMSLVATLGVAQFLLAFSAVVNGTAQSGSVFPQPAFLPDFNIGVLLVTRAYSAMLLLSPTIVLALVVFLRRSRYGVAIRASAANTERALMAGISAGRMSTLAWMLAGAVAGVTTVLIIPTRGFLTAETLGPALLLRALAPAVIARMTSLPIALGAGIVIGVVDETLSFNFPTSGLSELVLLLVIVGALLLQAKRTGRLEDKQDWSRLQPWGPLPEAFQRVRSIRLVGPVTGAVALAIAVLVGLRTSNNGAVTLIAITVFSLIGLSIGITTGLAGQLSLGQFALAGVGAITAHVVIGESGNDLLGLVSAAAVGGAVAIVLALPALRVRGLLLGVITLSFALTAQRWLFAQPWAIGDGISTRRPRLGGFEIDSTSDYYLWTLAVFVVGFLLARNVWRGGIGRRLRGARDNEDALRAFGVSPTTVKLQGFVIAGALAGMAGALYGQLLARLSAQSFDVVTGINTVALTVLGGVGVLAGPVLGALYIIGLPRFLPLDNAGLAATSLGWLLLILYFPGGLAEIVARPRAWLIDRLARRAGLDPEAVRADEAVDGTESARFGAVAIAPARRADAAEHADLLVATGLVKHFGGIRAVDGVDLELRDGEILGLLGPNGAGKTTLFELLGGFTTQDAGSVRLRGREIGRLPAHARAQLGLIRSFQDAALFPTLTVLETMMLSLERRQPTPFLGSLVGSDPGAAAKERRARELIALMGLDRYRNKQIAELSTGTRRITELGCILALEPAVLLLDEPSSGIAQREGEALGELLLRLRATLDCSLVVIEHDVPLLMSLSDRVMAMDTGRVIAVGTPEEIRNHPVVVESYLGGDVTAVERSGARREVVPA